MTLPILFDTDPGVDDAMALLLALASPELDVVGVTTIFGNSDDIGLMTANALAILALAGRVDIPVAAGSAHPLTRPYAGRAHLVHGDNCLGGAVLLPSPRRAEPTFAAQFIVESCRARPGEITLVAVGPLTNLALALRIEPAPAKAGARRGDHGWLGPRRRQHHACRRIQHLRRCRGGAAGLWLPAGRSPWPGWTSPVRRASPNPILNAWRPLGNRAGRFLADAFVHYLAFYRSRGFSGACMHDVHAVMPLVHPEFYTHERVCIDVETAGELDARARPWPISAACGTGRPRRAC